MQGDRTFYLNVSPDIRPCLRLKRINKTCSIHQFRTRVRVRNRSSTFRFLSCLNIRTPRGNCPGREWYGMVW